MSAQSRLKFTLLLFLVLPLFYLGSASFAQTEHGSQRQGKLIFEEHFSKPLQTKIWKSEIDPVLYSSVFTKKGKLIMDTGGGVTVWLNKELEGNIKIEYDWTVLVDSGRNDRLSDLNQFWMASDPENKNLFTRNGKFEEYDSLRLYYVGFGGNTNTTTRFRKYYGDGQKPLIREYLDSDHLLKANKTYHITIIVSNGTSYFWVDGVRFFEFKDSRPFTKGYFGFRSTAARHAIDNFKVFQLK